MMKNDPKEFELEQKYLANTLTAVNNRLGRLDSFVRQQIEDVTEMKRHLSDDAWDIDPEELVLTHSKVNSLVDFTNGQIRESYMLNKALRVPYFGRIDFLIDGDNEPMQVYVGLIGIEDAGEYYVFDWRAPVSELFYESGLGRAAYRAPQGKMKGEVTLKRQYVIKRGELKQVYEVDLNIADEFLQAILSEHKDTSVLHSIASSIQAEQNKIIRNSTDNVLVVQGRAGSGKTTVALHRIAYMLYREKNITSSNVLVFSPNSAFSSYISGILPELGEENTREATFVKFVKRILKTSADIESQDEFVTRFAKLKDVEKAVVLEKLNMDIEGVLDSYLKRFCRTLRFTGELETGAGTISERDLNNMLHEHCITDRVQERISNIAENIAISSGINTPKALTSLRDNLIGRLNKSIKLTDIYNGFNKAVFNLPPLGEKLSFEDAVLLCVLKGKVQNVLVKMDVRHIIIDEAQDYPLLLLKFLVEIFPRSKFTVLGDINQKTLPLPDDTLLAFSDMFKEHGSFVVLNESYRSSEEIVEYAGKIIGEDSHNAFRLKVNRPVIEHKASEFNNTVLSDVESLIKAGDKSIGIIVDSIASAKDVYKQLKPKLGSRLGLVNSSEAATLAPIMVIPALLAKGLEFDSCVVLCKGALTQDNLFYIACTRAIHGLIVYL
ncbi:MAG: AAA family ATPase [Firmicutes bacterium]|nr:AAA family ATPase [Bacillota bacterium]